MGLRDILKKKDKIEGSDGNRRQDAVNSLQAPEFTFIRSDTNTEEIIHPPSDPNSLRGSHEDVNFLSASDAQHPHPHGGGTSQPRRLSDAFKSQSRDSSASSRNSSINPEKPSPVRRISQRLRLKRGHVSSENVPQDLPEIVVPANGQDADQTAAESQWEKRATILAKTANENELHRIHPPTPPTDTIQGAMAGLRIVREDGQEHGVASSPAIDADIQEAIRLHEEGDLRESTRLFGILAEPKGANNPLSQVLYGLALRHGWGCEPDPERAVFYLSSAAKNAADVESLALQAGLKKGGAAKGELVLAIFELANCFRHGWGIEKDAIAAKQWLADIREADWSEW
ncbi:hypothetical protein SLS53_003119 [Cytospora paraplurivora]|uniref:Uncharacterized protein n=1 Tax=Cytospora paraplurivora TaxID=2898453 RepID=A0AAN9UDE0_9PEZI